ncbi:hypothetical protein [Mesorhizobium sp.]|uniref:hypothetical protein n=1 Tax=Mesorhizobium sp. TaxID=1871066 RepID=UPI000FE2CEF6|nr:hypothetical protein [Mesorhizobium sp.]RWH71795.1 MAG: hypothetical protein EOQ84_12060 [Mesorhizobium sp.]RWL32802.1 MAG: hypothetical protein EOR58_02755 [Mesorhizobium sp.]RWL33810.1 MAG: hypothetical protein EOR63_07535 [Mesorhizobium sp.]RWL39903.1 MAG: hypothetical protein EOR59_05240 [Mesorhizobium sp.]RWL51193.1 MAG: hypothetical protein EOR62_21925 [Mesorhizobium sp.]
MFAAAAVWGIVLRVIYFHSDTHPYDKAIYPGVGPAFARPLGWEARPISGMDGGDFDTGVVDNRLEQADVARLRRYLEYPAKCRRPIFFRISDPDMPDTLNPSVRFIFDCADLPGVHYATTYDPEGPFLAFTRRLKASGVARLPFAYDSSREIDAPLRGRSRRLFLSGANSRELYPVRYALRRRRRWSPLLRHLIHDLEHPGYPEQGKLQRHDITHDRFVALAARFTHFLLCGTRFNVELMKYVECAYAGSVPVGVPANSLSAGAKRCFRPYTVRSRDLVSDLREPILGLEKRAAAYRDAMRELRSPSRIVGEFVAQASAIVAGRAA